MKLLNIVSYVYCSIPINGRKVDHIVYDGKHKNKITVHNIDMLIYYDLKDHSSRASKQKLQ